MNVKCPPWADVFGTFGPQPVGSFTGVTGDKLVLAWPCFQHSHCVVTNLCKVTEPQPRAVPDSVTSNCSHCRDCVPSSREPKQTVPLLLCMRQVFCQRREESSQDKNFEISPARIWAACNLGQWPADLIPILLALSTIYLREHLGPGLTDSVTQSWLCLEKAQDLVCQRS